MPRTASLCRPIFEAIYSAFVSFCNASQHANVFPVSCNRSDNFLNVVGLLVQFEAKLLNHVFDHTLAFAGLQPGLPANPLHFEAKRLKVTVVATFEVAANEVRDVVERNIADALFALAPRGRLETAYELIR